ncbi:hypothetical protein FS842_004284 [Serendipita sp. 407]|nr:hypothetical protein FS842_004284 [Serendipita sp. 407]
MDKTPSISRIPAEIWLIIFDLFVEDLHSFPLATTFKGKSWALYTRHDLFEETERFFVEFEARRRLIRSISKSWRELVSLQRDRYLNYTWNGHDDDLYENVSIAKGVSVGYYFRPYWPALLSSIRRGVDWQVAALDVEYVQDICHVPHPQLRRLDIESWRSHQLVIGEWIESFQGLTWLKLAFNTLKLAGDGQYATLPNLEVLVLHLDTFAVIPLKAPKLQHLYLNLSYAEDTYTFNIPLSTYGRTLRSLAIRSSSGLIFFESQFVLSYKFTALEELALYGRIKLDGSSIPRMHPLRRLFVTTWNSDSINNWLDLSNIQEIHLVGGIQTECGILAPPLTSAETNALLGKAETRGVQVYLEDSDWDGPTTVCCTMKHGDGSLPPRHQPLNTVYSYS